jgi:hypothetical protein
MVTTVSTSSALETTTRSLGSGHVPSAILLAGLAVGLLDATDGVAYAGLTQGLNPIQVLQFVASGALGPSAFSGGLLTAAAGLGFHFLIAYAAAAVFAIAYIRLKPVRHHWAVTGLAFGVVVWAVMNLVVVPASAIGAFPTVAGAIHGIIGHALTVGLTAAYVVRRQLATKA